MRIAILTTDTLHHTFFARELEKHYSQLRVFVETDILAPPFEVHHPFEESRGTHERATWFDGVSATLKNVAETETFASLNSNAAVDAIHKFNPDMSIVFGTQKLGRSVIDCCQGRLVNLHGGDPRKYRGLDTHLWAIYHNAFDGLVSTLHEVATSLDAGAIIALSPLPITKGMKLHHLRAINTEICLNISIECLRYFEQNGTFDKTAQESKGRYYSFMPSVLKEICLKKFEEFTRQIS